MAGVATKKIGADLGVQLTFPEVFQDLYADAGPMESYFPDRIRYDAGFWAGKGSLQDLYHAQKTADAHRMAMAKVAATRSAERMMLASHQNYFGMPRPVLSQRVYANPSLGAAGIGGDIYAARHDQMAGAGSMVGGVLRTAKGQRFGRQMLLDRVGQLNAINAAKSQMLLEEQTGPAPEFVETETAITQDLPSKESDLQIELFSLLEDIRTAAYERKLSDQLSVANVSKMVRLLVRWAPTANREDMEAVQSLLDATFYRISDLSLPFNPEEAALVLNEPFYAAEANKERLSYISRILLGAKKYITEMIATTGRSAAEKRAASNNLVRSIGLFKEQRLGKEISSFKNKTFQKIRAQRKAVKEAAEQKQQEAQEAADEEASQLAVAREPIGRFEERAPRAAAQPAGANRGRGRMRGRGVGRAALTPKFSRDTRQAFGARQGAYAGDWNALPVPGEGEIPERMTHRKPVSNRMPVRETPQMAPSFPDAARGAAAVGAPLGMTRASLPTTRDGFVALADQLRGMGHGVRINKNSQLKNIRANFIKKFKL